MTWLWTWGGTCFGYRSDDKLFTKQGRQVGRFHGDEVYGANGRYLGELRDGRLIRRKGGKAIIHGSFTPTLGGSYTGQANYVGYVMLAGYEDFPGPESFR